MIDRVPDELCTEVHDIVQETILKKSCTSSRKRNQKSKITVLGGLTNSYEKKRSKKQRIKRKMYLFECRDPKNSKER